MTLTLLPGTTIKVADYQDDTHSGVDASRVELIVQGALNVTGTATQPVAITSSAVTPAAGDWVGIRNYGVLSLEYTTLEYGKYGVSCEHKSVTGSCTFTNATIRYTSGNAVYASGSYGGISTLNISYSEFHNNAGRGVYAEANSW